MYTMQKLRKAFNKDGSIRKVIYPDGSRRYWINGDEADYGFYGARIINKWNNRHAPKLTVNNIGPRPPSVLQGDFRRSVFEARGRYVNNEVISVVGGGVVSVQLPSGTPGYPVGSLLSVDDNGGLVVYNPNERRSVIGSVLSSSGGTATIVLDSQVSEVVV